MSVRITKAFSCVPSGAVHARMYDVGEVTSDPDVMAVALRNRWGERPETDRDTGTASAAAVASASIAPSHPSGDPPPKRKSRAAAPENK